MTTDTKLPAPPYVAFRTFQNFLDWLGEVGVPSRIDRSFWGQKLSGGYGAQLMAAFRFFDLIDENGVPDPILEQIAKDKEQRKQWLASIITKQYNNALNGLDLGRATIGELSERFHRYNVSGETFRRALTFFIHACRYCGIPLSPHITKRKSAPTTNGTTARPRKRGRAPKTRPTVQGQEPEGPASENIERLGLHPSVEALLRDLNRIASNWNPTDRERWVQTFLAVLDYAYPTKEVQKRRRE